VSGPGAPTRAGSELIGREADWGRVSDLLSGVAAGGGSLLLRGDAGIGKSALLGQAHEYATDRGLRVLSTVGVRSETAFPFAALERLIDPLGAGIDALPSGQRRALLSAFGREAEAAPEVFIVGLAVLTLLSDAAADGPVVIIVDDLQWVDAPTDDVLQFIARRLQHEPVVLLAAVRDGATPQLVRTGVPELHLAPLDDVAAAELLDRHAPDLDADARAQLLADSAGNPLALVELPSAASKASATGVLPLTARLERAFTDRVRALPLATRQVLAVAALNDAGTFAETLAAARALLGSEVDHTMLGPAVEERVIDVTDDSIAFRHPLIRAAVHRSVSPSQRRAAHAALAAATGDEDRRAVHRGHAAAGPDEAVARDLDALARRASARGGDLIAIGALERAAELSEHPTESGRRLLAAATIANTLGRDDELRRLLAKTDAMPLSDHQRMRVAFMRQQAELATDAMHGDAGSCAMAECAERAIDAGDLGLAGTLLAGAGTRVWFWNQTPETQARLAEAADLVAAATTADNAHVMRCYADAAPRQRGAVVIDALDRLAGRETDADTHFQLGMAASGVGAFAHAILHFRRAIDGLREYGRLGQLSESLAGIAFAAMHRGDFQLTVTAAAEGQAIANEIGQSWAALMMALPIGWVAAIKGDTDTALAAATELEAFCLPRAGSGFLAHALRLRALAASASGHHAQALAYLLRLYDPTDVAGHEVVGWLAVGDLVEAAVYCGDRSALAPILELVERRAAATPSPALLAGLRYARALMAGDEHAEARFQEALAADAGSPFDRARIELSYAQWLRRRRRIVDARPLLRAAIDAFDALGAEPWSARARRELAASGETSRRHVASGVEDLTPQELQIASLAAEGMTNRDIGRLLYVSPRTVGSHLYRIFPKLGITSRAELRGVLEGGQAES
jgi:DNA-binding CsgD family transcriptional regulator